MTLSRQAFHLTRTALLLALTTSASAQFQFAVLRKVHLPEDSDAYSLASGDVDGDGLPDLVIGKSGQNRLFLNRPNALFVDATKQLPTDTSTAQAVLLLDVDGDKDLDLVMANGDYASPQWNALFLNGGRGNFSKAPFPNSSWQTFAVASGDFDRDGDPDLAFANFSGQNEVYLNNGRGVFTLTNALPSRFENSCAIAAADVDGDGDLDLIVGNAQQSNRLLLNDGRGKFSDSASGLPKDTDLTFAVAAADVDRDGDVDLVFGNATEGKRQSRLFLNNGRGVFTDVTKTRLPLVADRSRALQFADVDRDGDFDLVLATYGKSRLYLNDGKGNFSDASSRLPEDSATSLAVVASDLDRDGFPDLVFGGAMTNGYGGETRFYRNVNHGSFEDSTALAFGVPVDFYADRDCVVADFDGNGTNDLVVATGVGMTNSTDQNRIYFNQAGASLRDGTAASMPIDSDPSFAVAAGDVDGDGDLDLVFGNSITSQSGSGQNRLYLNDGRGRFTDVTASQLPVAKDPTYAVELADVDGDRDLDLLVGNLYGNGPTQNRLYLNDGKGKFTDATRQLPAVPEATRALAVGDVDGDGDLDVVVGNSPLRANHLLLNNGRGTFSLAQNNLPTLSTSTADLALADVDADGDLDIVEANGDDTFPFAGSEQNRLYLNDGKGVFKDATARLPAANGVTSTVDVGDVDEDGDIDIVFGDSTIMFPPPPQNVLLYLNDGKGTFSDASPRIKKGGLPGQAELYCTALAIRDMDGDGDRDIVAVTTWHNRVFLNLHRQAHLASDVRVGLPARVNFYVEPGYGQGTKIIAPYLSLGLLAAPVRIPPFGLFRLNPATLVVGTPFTSSAGGMTSLVWSIPGIPGLKGLTLDVQALVLHGPNLPTWRLTNASSQAIR